MSTPSPRPNVNSMAIVSFVVSFLGICGAVVGTVLAIVSLRTIKRTGERGRGFAIAALWISVLWLAVAIGLVSLARVADLFGDSSAQVNTLGSGTCVESIREYAPVTHPVIRG